MDSDTVDAKWPGIRVAQATTSAPSKKWQDMDILDMKNSIKEVQKSIKDMKETINLTDKDGLVYSHDGENEGRNSAETTPRRSSSKGGRRPVLKHPKKKLVRDSSREQVYSALRAGSSHKYPTTEKTRKVSEDVDGQWGDRATLMEQYENLDQKNELGPRPVKSKPGRPLGRLQERKSPTTPRSVRDWHQIQEEKRYKGFTKVSLPVVDLLASSEGLGPGASLSVGFSNSFSRRLSSGKDELTDFSDPLGRSFTEAKGFLEQILNDKDILAVDNTTVRRSSYVKKEKLRQYLLNQQQPRFRLRKSSSVIKPVAPTRDEVSVEKENDMQALLTEQLAVAVTFEPDVKEVFKTRIKTPTHSSRSKIRASMDRTPESHSNGRRQERSKLEELLDIRPDPLVLSRKKTKAQPSVDKDLAAHKPESTKETMQIVLASTGEGTRNESRSDAHSSTPVSTPVTARGHTPRANERKTPIDLRKHDISHLVLPDITGREGAPELKLVSQAAKRTFYRGSFSASCWKGRMDASALGLDVSGVGTDNIMYITGGNTPN